MEFGLSHHDHNDPAFLAHVIVWRDNAYCLGCTASKIFLHLILPLLVMVTIRENIGLASYAVFNSLLALSTFVTILEIVKGKPLNAYSKIPVNVYVVFSLLLVATTDIGLGLYKRLAIATVLSIPQFGIYATKIGSKREFKMKGIKFSARLLFIAGFYFALVDLVSDPMIATLYIAFVAYLFIKTREFSSYSAGGSLHAYLPDWASSLVSRYSAIATPLLFLLFLAGVARVVSSPTCLTPAVTIPFVSMNNIQFCPNCGDPVESYEKFCDKCGTNLTNVGSSAKAMDQPATPASPYSPQQGAYPPQQGFYPPQQGAYPKPFTRKRSDEEKWRAAGIVGLIIAGIVFILTSNVVSAIVAGLVGALGTFLFLSTDSCCIQYCILESFSDCICSIIEGADD